MIEVPRPRDAADRLWRLYAFAEDVLAVCDEVGVKPVMDGSLAVRAYTRDPEMTVRDVDFNCPEADFPRLHQALQAAGIFAEIQPWQVLQARRGDLKVEFGASEVWLEGITGPHETIMFGGRPVQVVNREMLRDLYRRGYEATKDDADQPDKHAAIAVKLRALDRFLGRGPQSSG